MMKTGLRFPALVLLALSLIGSAAAPAFAGASCRDRKVSVVEMQSAIDVAQRTREYLNRSGGSVALIARVGSDISDYGLKYTHMGLARKRASDGEWVVVQQLNPCASDGSKLYMHGLANFMLDDLLTHDVLLVTLKPNLQESIQEAFRRDLPLRIYDPNYSMISYPGLPPKYQNSNQWVLEILAQAQANLKGETLLDRNATHTFYRRNGFQGSVVRISNLRRALAELTSGNVRFDDHPNASRTREEYETVSVRSVVEYVRLTGDWAGAYEIKGTYRRPSSPERVPPNRIPRDDR